MRDGARRALVVGRWLAVPLFAVLIWWLVDLRSVGARLARLDARFVVAFLLLSIPLYVICAWRWSFTADRLGAPLPFRRALLDYYLSTLLNQVLPVGVAGDVVRTARHRGRLADTSWGPPARAVILERFSGFAALTVFVTASAIAWLARGHGAFAIVLAGALASLVPFALLLRARSPWLRTLAADVRAALLERRALGVQLSTSLASVVMLLLMFACAARAVGVTLDAASIVLVVPLVLAATTLPWAFAGWGAREATTAALFGLAGIGAADGVAVSIAFGVLSLVASAPGVVVLCLPQPQRSTA